MYEFAWNALNINYRYVHSVIGRCGLDVILEVVRICYDAYPISLKSENMPKEAEYLKKMNLIFSDRLVQNMIYQKPDQITQYKYSWFFVFLKNVNLFVTTPKFSQRSKLKSSNVKDEDEQGSWTNEPSMSVFKVVEYLYYIITDFKNPLQVGSFRSLHISSIINECMTDMVRILRLSLTADGGSVLMNRELQNFFRNPPMEQIVYWLNEQNQLQENKWYEDINLFYLKNALNKKYSSLSIYNFILMFDLRKNQNKKHHDSFIK